MQARSEIAKFSCCKHILYVGCISSNEILFEKIISLYIYISYTVHVHVCKDKPGSNKHHGQFSLFFQPQRIEVLYWKERQAMHSPEQGFPTFIYSTDKEHDLYGLPAYEYPGLVKVDDGFYIVVIAPV